MVAPATIVIQDNLYDSAGNAVANATVSCVLNSSVETTSGGLIFPRQQSATTDGNGFWSFKVVANDLLSPANSTYTISTPFRQYDVAPQSANGSPQQSTAANVIVNTPSALAPSTSNITGNLTIAGTLTVSGLVTAQAGLTVSGGTLSIPAGGFSMAGPLTLTAAASQIIPGATSFSVRDTANANDNLLISNAGAATVRAGLTVTAGGLIVTAGNITATSSNLNLGAGTITSGAVNSQTISAAASFTGSVTVANALTVTAGGLVVTAGNLTMTAGNLTFAVAASRIVPGATSLSLRNNANNADNLMSTDAGLVTLRNALSLPPVAAGTVSPTSYGTIPVKISEQLLIATSTDIVFASLPTGFRHLLLELQARGDTAATTVECGLRFSNDSGANYAWTSFSAQGTGTTSAESGAGTPTSIRNWSIAAANAQAGTAGAARIWIPNYNATVFKKSARIEAQWFVTAAFAASGNTPIAMVSGQWNSTAAITQLDVIVLAGNFIIGSLFTLWGIP